ncbi:hypothetical protein [Methyloceanibacter marginalis]|uniref:hypothetical protein n=1 Tax=Methyloceanibacter marginalis TaxID=1774971 RepID=UPI001958407D|nr:hypothetical protein [Methyloceanibacter marginalis]
MGAIVLFGILGTAIITLTFLPALSISVFRLAGYGQKAGGKSSAMEPSPAPGE